MKITVFTPIHKYNKEYFQDLYLSVHRQTFSDFEWLILLNGEAIESADTIRSLVPWARVELFFKTGNVGALKAACCEMANGEILVELDYDDQLVGDALEKIAEAFTDSNVQFAYSNFVEHKNGMSRTYSAAYGWHNRSFFDMQQNVAFPEQAHYMRRIEWAPNHVRAFRKSAYDILGYDKELAVGDDHDLVCKFYVQYGERGFKHIDECLYIYRLHDDNTCSTRNDEVQRQVDLNYQKYAERMYLRWAQDNNLLAIDLGGRFNCPPGYRSVDLLDADYIVDLEKPWTQFEDNSVGVIRAYHLLEHLDDTIHFFNEAFRVLAPGGFLLIEVPSVKGDGAFADPTHKKFFNTLSFEYFTNENQARFIRPQYNGRFQKARVVEYWWSNPRIPVISAQLIALKGWYDERWCGLKEI